MEKFVLPKDFSFQGHRGARGLVPENIIASFLKCLELGVHTFELDVVVSQDKQLVVSHEAWMSHHFCSLPDGRSISESIEKQHLLYQMPYAQIKTYDCGKNGHAKFPQQIPMPAYKPLFSEVVVACDQFSQKHQLPITQFNLEVKSYPKYYGQLTPQPEEYAVLVNTVLEKTGIKNRVVVQSFDPAVVQAMRQVDPNLPLSLLVENKYSLAQNIDHLGFIPTVYAPHYLLIDAAMMTEAHAMGMKVITWTVNTLEEINALIELGVDGVITDYPNLRQHFT